MEEERRAPRRLLSFDASRFSRVLYPTKPLRSPFEDEPSDSACTFRAPSEITSLAASPDSRYAAITGKNFLSVLEIPSAGSAHNTCALNHSVVLDRGAVQPTALAWGCHASSNTIATSSAAGLLQLYTLGPSKLLPAPGRSSKLSRTVSCLEFASGSGGTVLVAALHDGSVRLFDVRQQMRRPLLTFARPGDIAREVRFKPDSDTKLAVVYDSGIVQRWDVRKPHAADLRLNAHMQGLCLSWHPKANALATGGRDKRVHVWDLSRDQKSPEISVGTASSVSRVRWIPGENTVGASAIVTSRRGAVLDSVVSVWNLKRPLVPHMCLEAHTQTVSEVAAISSNRIWSVGKDGLFVQHDLRHEPTLAQNLPTGLVAWSGNTEACMLHSVAPSYGRALHSPGSQVQSQPQSVASSYAGHAMAQLSSGQVTPITAQTPASSYGFPFVPEEPTPRTMKARFAPPPPPPPQRQLSATSDNQLSPPFLIWNLDTSDASPQTLNEVCNGLWYVRPYGKRLGDVCRHNASVILAASYGLRTARMWSILGEAVDAMEADFLRTMDENALQLATSWLEGRLPEEMDEEAVVDDEDCKLVPPPLHRNPSSRERQVCFLKDTWATSSFKPSGVSMFSENSATESEGLPLPSRAGDRRRRSSLAPYEPSYGDASDVCESFYQYAIRQTKPWNLVPMLGRCISYTLENSLFPSSAALAMLFRPFEALPPARLDAIIVSCVECMRAQGCFVPAASIIAVSSAWEAQFGKKKTLLDTLCYKCHNPRSERFCQNCLILVDLCSFCGEALRGLATTLIGCGHQLHANCYSTWLAEGVFECPAGCGESL